ncbi:hypothetical protein [Sulfurimonas sp.]
MKLGHIVILLGLVAMIFSSCARHHHYGPKYYKRANVASEKAQHELSRE